MPIYIYLISIGIGEPGYQNSALVQFKFGNTDEKNILCFVVYYIRHLVNEQNEKY